MTETIISESLPELINNAISANGKTVESRIDTVLDSLIKSRVKKAIK